MAVASEHDRYRLGALIFEKRRVLSRAVNRPRTHPLQHRYNPFAETVHAEVGAIIEGKRLNLRGATIAIARVTLPGHPACSYPCAHCKNALADAGIHRIVCYGTSGEPIAVDLRS